MEHLPAAKIPTYGALQTGGHGISNTSTASKQVDEEEGEKSAEPATQQDVGFQAFTEVVLESMVLSLVQQSAAGDWDET
jgi:hypothetical protein